MTIPFWACHPENYKKGRASKIEYIVMHYTSNNGDTARGNCQYFAGSAVKSSAHYFVDENEVWQSVKDTDTAWHCGAKTYRHPECRNANSIGVELCSDKVNGQYVITAETVSRAVELVKELAAKYGIDRNHIIRHFDVTGKLCPEPWVREESQYLKFLDRVFTASGPAEKKEDTLTQAEFNQMMDSYLAQRNALPDAPWGEEWDLARAWAEAQGIVRGDNTGAKKYQGFPTRQELVTMLYRMGR